MSGLFAKFLGGNDAGGAGHHSRRHSGAGSSSRHKNHNQHQQHHHNQHPHTNTNQDYLGPASSSSASQQEAAAEASRKGSNLSLPRNSSGGSLAGGATTGLAIERHRRASRSSIHSLSAMLMGAFTSSSQANGRSIIAKNKEDTLIIAASSPTIVQKESSEGGASPAVSAGSSLVASPLVAATLDATATAAAAELVVTSNGIGSGAGGRADHQQLLASSPILTVLTSGGHDRELAVASLVGAAAAAALDPRAQQPGALPQLATVGTCNGTQASDSCPPAGPQTGTTGHAPLNASNTMKQAAPAQQQPGSGSSPRRTPTAGQTASQQAAAARRCEVLRATEALLEALNQGDYEAYTRLCDPHMSSIEPETMNQLVDNMELRRFCLDQAQHQLARLQLGLHQSNHSSSSASGPASASSSASTLNKPQMNDWPATTLHPNQCASSSVRHYSLMLNPSVSLLGDSGAFIAYTRLSQQVDLQTGQLSVSQSAETRVWQRQPPEVAGNPNKWLCLHLHRSLAPTSSMGQLQNSQHHQQPSNCAMPLGPETSVSLARCLSQQASSSASAGLRPLISLANPPTSQQPQQQQQANLSSR